MESTDVEENPVFPIDLSIFKEQIEQNLLNILDLMPKLDKTLILEKSLISKLSFFTRLEPLKKRQIIGKLATFSKEPPTQRTPILLYMIPSQKELLEIIQSHIEDNIKKTSISIFPIDKKKNKNEEDKEEEIKKEFHIIFVPKISNECNNFIKNSNFSAQFHVYNFNMDIFPLDYDLLSLEDYASFYNLYVEQNLNCISVLTRAIIKYESIFGKIKYKYYKGFLAEKLNKALSREEEISTSIDKNNDPGTFCCFIFDRAVDMITPFCTQFVYEGLLDDYFGINFNLIKVNPKILEKKELNNDFIRLDLSKNEKFYTKIKDYSFNEIKAFLPKRLKEHNKILEESKNKKLDLDAIQENITKMKDLKDERPSLINHINLADYISKKQKMPKEKLYLNMEQNLLVGDTPSNLYEFIEDELAKKSEEYNFFRILCLESLVHSGIKNKIYEQLKKDIINIYGFQEIFLLRNLEKMNILKNSDGTNLYSLLNKNFKLINESIDENNPNDSSYAYNGYCPLFIRLIEKALTKGWNSIRDLLGKIPGDFDCPKDEKEIIDNNNKERKFILLVFIGGITYGELGAIRYLNNHLGDKKFIVLTTSMINTKKIFNSLRQGKYEYTLPDETSINNVDSNTFEINSEKRFTFKDFEEQTKTK